MMITVSLIVLVCQLVSSHVSLKYPPARNIDLDFLDSFRTPGDCGMDPGDKRTSLIRKVSKNEIFDFKNYCHNPSPKSESKVQFQRTWT